MQRIFSDVAKFLLTFLQIILSVLTLGDISAYRSSSDDSSVPVDRGAVKLYICYGAVLFYELNLLTFNVLSLCDIFKRLNDSGDIDLGRKIRSVFPDHFIRAIAQNSHHRW